tara:strand:+ start:71 stop:463 length:393 start_codon:yes stop_codon:yes gene_type:complete
MGITTNFDLSASTGSDISYGTLAAYKYVRGDTGPRMQISLNDQLTGFPRDITGAQALLHLRPVGGRVILTRELYINEDTALNGEAIVIWEEGDLDVAPGNYECEIEVIFPGGLRETLFDIIILQIRADFA